MLFWGIYAVITASVVAYIIAAVTTSATIATAAGLLAGAAVIGIGAVCCIAGEADQ